MEHFAVASDHKFQVDVMKCLLIGLLKLEDLVHGRYVAKLGEHPAVVPRQNVGRDLDGWGVGHYRNGPVVDALQTDVYQV